MFYTPATFADIGLHIAFSLVGGLVFGSFVEHAIHRNVMHSRPWYAWVLRIMPELQVLFHHHAVLHHGTYYKEFDYEPSAEGKHFNLRILPADTRNILMAFLPVLLLIGMFVSTVSMVTVLAVVVGHNLAWGVVHTQMHVPDPNCWFADTAYFRFIARHHFLHHQRVSRNYNVVLPLADFVLATTAKPRLRDVREMLRLGYLEPRTETGRRVVAVQRVAARGRVANAGLASAVAAFVPPQH